MQKAVVVTSVVRVPVRMHIPVCVTLSLKVLEVHNLTSADQRILILGLYEPCRVGFQFKASDPMVYDPGWC